ncbi:hypothetical protein, partial [Bacillus pseudomycoides]|uniref:hypothetical protein n=2 Tax=Bacillus TaxID=1386 RepID=UPI002FFDA340
DNINYFSLELLNVFFHNEILLNIFKSIDIFFIIFLSTWAYLIFKNSDERYKKPITIAYSGLLIILTSFNGIASYIATNL